MAYDEELADRIRELVGTEPDLTEKKMFGGLAFLIGGNMAVAASSQGGVLVRVDPAQSDTLVATTNARLMEMRGRRMQGWLRVDPEDLRTKPQLAEWVERGDDVRSLATREAIGKPNARGASCGRGDLRVYRARRRPRARCRSTGRST
jgi:TfoX/Sxy family transcriptional regulator of competence genes